MKSRNTLNEEIMRIDFEYIKNLLEIVLEHDQPDFDLNHEKLKPLWSNDDEEKITITLRTAITKNFWLFILRNKANGDLIITTKVGR